MAATLAHGVPVADRPLYFVEPPKQRYARMQQLVNRDRERAGLPERKEQQGRKPRPPSSERARTPSGDQHNRVVTNTSQPPQRTASVDREKRALKRSVHWMSPVEQVKIMTPESSAMEYERPGRSGAVPPTSALPGDRAPPAPGRRYRAGSGTADRPTDRPTSIHRPQTERRQGGNAERSTIPFPRSPASDKPSDRLGPEYVPMDRTVRPPPPPPSYSLFPEHKAHPDRGGNARKTIYLDTIEGERTTPLRAFGRVYSSSSRPVTPRHSGVEDYRTNYQQQAHVVGRGEGRYRGFSNELGPTTRGGPPVLPINRYRRPSGESVGRYDARQTAGYALQQAHAMAPGGRPPYHDTTRWDRAPASRQTPYAASQYSASCERLAPHYPIYRHPAATSLDRLPLSRAARGPSPQRSGSFSAAGNARWAPPAPPPRPVRHSNEAYRPSVDYQRRRSSDLGSAPRHTAAPPPPPPPSHAPRPGQGYAAAGTRTSMSEYGRQKRPSVGLQSVSNLWKPIRRLKEYL